MDDQEANYVRSTWGPTNSDRRLLLLSVPSVERNNVQFIAKRLIILTLRTRSLVRVQKKGKRKICPDRLKLKFGIGIYSGRGWFFSDIDYRSLKKRKIGDTSLRDDWQESERIDRSSRIGSRAKKKNWRRGKENCFNCFKVGSTVVDN